METKRAAALISENLTAIYGYAFGKLYEKADADDLARKIVCAILASAGNLQQEGAFWGFAWRIAENTFRAFIRKKERGLLVDSEESAEDIAVPSPEETLIERETEREALFRLRRELAFLTKTNREVTVAYYLHEKSCSEIAKAQGISIDMVKYHHEHRHHHGSL